MAWGSFLSKDLKSKIKDLKEDDNVHTIKKWKKGILNSEGQSIGGGSVTVPDHDEDGHISPDGTPGVGTNTTIYWKRNQHAKGQYDDVLVHRRYLKRNMLLFHEIFHSWEAGKGIMSYEQTTTRGSIKIDNTELGAVRFENIIAKQMNKWKLIFKVPIRDHYGLIELKSKYHGFDLTE